MYKKKVILAISGGVDSAVSVHILQSLGYEVTGLNFIFWKWEDDTSKKQAARDILDDISQKFSIEIIQQDQRNYFKGRIVNQFIKGAENGLTPNPCVFCNPTVKFELLLKYAALHQFDLIATGHYARVFYEKVTDMYYLQKGVDETKDQSYMLCYLDQEILSRTIFPLGDKTKTEIVALGKELGLQSADCEESQDLCFVAPENYHAFLSSSITAQKDGQIVDVSGNTLGQHNGLFHYTIGQRKGIKVFSSEPYYVIGKNYERNELIIGHQNESDVNAFEVSDSNWIAGEPAFPLASYVKIRYRSKLIACSVTKENNGNMQVNLANSAKGITPGQYAVFYDGDIVLGGGKIVR